jgi:hypothetical protein
MISGNIDVVYGPKGSGKSALYTLINKKDGDLFDEGILLANAENVRGATVFRTIVASPPPSELSFVYLWKIYSLTIIARALRDYDIQNSKARSLISVLEKAGLLPTASSLSILFRAVTDYFRGWINRDVKAVEYAVNIDSATGSPTVTRKTEFAAKTEEQNLSDIPVEELFEIANTALEEESLSIWLLFDRLDVAFADSLELERNALRALFRAYNDVKAYEFIKFKIFVRDDIWRRITSDGFTEASHITKSVHIKWTEESLLNLVILRLLSNDALNEYLDIVPDEIKGDYNKQFELFYKIVPQKIDTGKNPDTFKWILSRTTDSSNNSVPREVIHMMDEAKSLQIKKIERGGEEPDSKILLDRSSFKEALPTISKVRFEQTLLAEYPQMRQYVMKLSDEKSEQTLMSLEKLWNTEEEETRNIARRLSEIGFFETRGAKADPTYWVPFLYRSALGLIQGKADNV